MRFPQSLHLLLEQVLVFSGHPILDLFTEKVKRLPKLAALERLGFGVLNKVALFFEEAFWPHTTDFFGRTAANKSERGSFFLFFNVHACTGRPVILALMAGSAAKSLEELDDDEVTERALEALRQMFGRVPQPTRVIVTRWGADEFSYGSYSFVGVGATGADYSTVAEPVGKELYFAGEHTSEEHSSTHIWENRQHMDLLGDQNRDAHCSS